MEQHPIPRQITTFEFKLIGFMTLRQFLYLLVFFPVGFIVFKLFPIPVINFLLGLAVAGCGVALAFVPINDRPMDVWIRNFYKRITSPTQYTFQKHNANLYFLKNLFFTADPHKVMAHIESQERLAEYLSKTRPVVQTASSAKRTTIQSLLQKPLNQLKPSAGPPAAVQASLRVQAVPPPIPPAAHATPVPPAIEAQVIQPQPIAPAAEPIVSSQPAIQAVAPHAALTGIVKNHKQIPLSGILVYIKDSQGKTLRLLKTNPHGVFATFHPLPSGEYFFEIKDPKGGYFFDTMKIAVQDSSETPLEFYSKELL